MNDPFVPRVGGTMSADIAVPEHERELRFYSRVLTTGEQPFWREDLMNNQGAPVIGLGARVPEYDHLPLQWMPHIQVADIEASVKCALALGGTQLMHAEGQWAVLLDPNGAAFGIIPVVSADAIPPVEGDPKRAGHIAWLDLTVPEAAATRDFYQQVVGWSAQDIEMKDAAETYADFNMLGGDASPAAGICHARGVNQDLPPTWLLYLPVGDLAESIRRVEEEGGQVTKSTLGSEANYQYAIVKDPVGAHFVLVQA
jgi:predicted enzyme related to lactoylglutathione lyase